MSISVVIPVWGSYTATLPRAVESVLAQDHDCEVIVVDNASEPPVMASDGVRLVRLDERVTLGSARNAGLASVNTPFVVFWDADDRMLPGALEVMHRTLDAEPDAVACACALVDGHTRRRHHFPRPWVSGLSRWPRVFAWSNAVWSLFPATGTLLRADAVRGASGFPDSEAGDDWALAAVLAFRGRIHLVEHLGRWYEQHPDSVSSHWRAYPHIFRNARLVRRQLRRTRGVPLWMRASLPLVAVLQVSIMAILRPPARLLRRRAAPGPPAYPLQLESEQPS